MYLKVDSEGIYDTLVGWDKLVMCIETEVDRLCGSGRARFDVM